MTRLILRALNAPALLLLIMIGISIQTSLFASYPLSYLQPDIVLLGVIWCAMRRDFTEGGILCLLFADLAELHSAVPRGFFLCTYMAVYLGICLISRVLVLPNTVSLVKLTIYTSMTWKVLNLLMLVLIDKGSNHWRHMLTLILPGAAIEGMAGLYIYRWLDRFDWITYKHPRTQQGLEDELRLDGEGL